MYAALLKFRSSKIEMEKANNTEHVKVKEERINEDDEYSEVRDGTDIKETEKVNKFNTKQSRSGMEPKGSIVDIKKEPLDSGPTEVKKEPVRVSEDSEKNPNSEVTKDSLGKEEEGPKSSSYISAESFKKNMHHMFPKVHADIVDEFKRDFCGLCGAYFDSEKRAWTHYFSPEHDHAVKKGKKYPYPPFWLMIKLALAEFKPAGASKKDIREFLVKNYPAVKTLKETEFYDRLGRNLVEMVTHFKNVVIDDEGLYKLGAGGNQYPHKKYPTKYFSSDKRFYIQDKERRVLKGDSRKSGSRYRDQMGRSRGDHDDHRVRGVGVGGRMDQEERSRRRSRSRSRDRSQRNYNSTREESRYQEGSRSDKISRRKEMRRSRSREIRRSRSREARRSRSRSKSRLNEKRSRYNSYVSRENRSRSPVVARLSEKIRHGRSPEKVSPPPMVYQQPQLQMPMLPIPAAGEGNHQQPIIIIPSNMASGISPEFLKGSFGMSGLQMFPHNSMMPQMNRSFSASTSSSYSFPTQSLYQIAPAGSGLPTPPLSTSPPGHTKLQQ